MAAGRPTKFTDDTRNKIIQALRGGNYRTVAAAYAGISHTTLRNWLIMAQDPHAAPEYVEFLADVEKAEADAEVADIALIRRAAQDGTWAAAAWIRERKNPDRWSKGDRLDVSVSGPDGGPVDVRVGVGADPASIASLAAILADRFAQRQDPLGPTPIEVIGQPGGDKALEAFRIVPGELGAGSPSLGSKGVREPSEPVSRVSDDEDVAEFVARRDEQAVFDEIVDGVAEAEGWGWDVELGDDEGDSAWWDED